MRARYWIAVILAVMFSVGDMTHAVTANGSDCEKKREECINSCAKQRKTCDANGNASDYCVKQDTACSGGCDKAWRKCSEKSSTATDFDLRSGSVKSLY